MCPGLWPGQKSTWNFSLPTLISCPSYSQISGSFIRGKERPSHIMAASLW